MLSISKPLSPEQASSYFHQDNYYLEEEGQWYGDTAVVLGMRGKVNRTDFLNLLNGFNSRGEKLVASAGAKDVLDINGNVKRAGHRSGVDLTFSAPKSVSILSYQDSRIDDAFKLALRETLDHVGKNFAYTQKKDKYGKVTADKTDNLLWGTFLHKASRELDPQLHCHCVLMNITQDKGGKFKTVHNDSIYKNKMYIGLIFRTLLAEKIKNLGYSIEVTDQKKGFFEIGGIGESVLGAFSKRRKQIEEEIQKLKASEKYPNCSDAELAAIATLNSRIAKKDVSQEHVISMINSTCQELGTSLAGLQQSAKAYKNPEVGKLSAEEILMYAVNGITEGQSTFTRYDLLSEAFKMGIGQYTVPELEAAFAKMQESGELAKIGEVNTKAGAREIYSSKEMIEVEKAVIQMCKEAKGISQIGVDGKLTDDFICRTDINLKMKSALELSEKDKQKAEAKFQKLLLSVSDLTIKEKLTEVRKMALEGGGVDAVDYPDLHRYFETYGYGFTPGQRDALKLITSTKDQFSVIQGDAGTGKSFSCLYAKKLAEEHGFTIRGFAPTGKATTGLASAAEIETGSYGTIDSFLIKYEKSKNQGQSDKSEPLFIKGKEIWLVDEAGMCGSKKFLRLMTAAKEAEAKVVFIGDRKQFQSIEAGRMFSELQDKAGVDMVTMPDVMRQKTAQTKEIVKAISLKDMDFAFNVMSGYKKEEVDVKNISNYAIGTMLRFSENVGDIPAQEECKVIGIDDKTITVEFFDDEMRRMQTAKIDPSNINNAWVKANATSAYENMITEESDRDKCLQLVAKDYLASVSAKKDTLLITGTNKDKDALNSIIRPELVSQGLITDSKEFTTLQTKSLSGTGAMMADSYKIGQTIKVNMKSGALNFDKGEIVASDRTKNTITVRERKEGGQYVDHEVDVRKHCKRISVFENKTCEFGAGDLIIFLSNEQKNIGVNNGETAKILSIGSDGTVRAKLEDGGKEVTFNLNDGHENSYKYISHAYAITDYKSQGATTSRLLWYAPTTGGPMSSNTFYVAITRCKEEVGVYTDNVEKLREMVKTEQHKESTLDYPVVEEQGLSVLTPTVETLAIAKTNTELELQKEKKDDILGKIQLVTLEAIFTNLNKPEVAKIQKNTGLDK